MKNRRRTLQMISLTVALSLVVVLSACYGTSVYPFYKDGDLLYDTDLLGDWNGMNGTNKVSIIIKTGPGDNQYFVIHFEDGKSLVYIGHLFDFNKSHYLDLIPYNKLTKDSSKDDVNMLLTHSIWKVAQNRDKLQFYVLDQKKLQELANRADARYQMVDGNIVLTGTTAEVQDLMGAHMEELFPSATASLELKRDK